jgi:hypothetical protein
MRGVHGLWCSVVLVMAATFGCGVFAPTVRPDERPGPSDVYLYGRFYIHTEVQGLGFKDQSMGFAIRCRDGKNYVIPFSEERPVQVIKVHPGICQLDEILFTDGGGTVRGRQLVTFRLLGNEILQPGGVYYVGDFVATAASVSEHSLVYQKSYSAWRLAARENNYARTTQLMREIFPLFASRVTEDRMPRPGKRRAPAPAVDPRPHVPGGEAPASPEAVDEGVSSAGSSPQQ